MRALDVLVATNRPLIVAFGKQLGDRTDPRIAIRSIPLTREDTVVDPGSSAVALVDMGADADAGVALCGYFRRSYPQLPIVARFCCPSPAMPSHIRGLLDVGVRNLLDAQATREEIVNNLHALARGDLGLRVQLHREYEAFWDSADVVSDEAHVVLKLVAQGFGDAEIATPAYEPPHGARACRGAAGSGGRQESHRVSRLGGLPTAYTLLPIESNRSHPPSAAQPNTS